MLTTQEKRALLPLHAMHDGPQATASRQLCAVHVARGVIRTYTGTALAHDTGEARAAAPARRCSRKVRT